MTTPPATARGGRWLLVARVAFLAAAVGFGWLWLRDDWSDVVAAMGTVGTGSWLVAVLLVLVGLSATGVIWTRAVRGFGHRVPLREAFSVFFVGQLGKYIPGSVWSLGAQAQMGTRLGVPPRSTVAAGLVFLGWNVVTAVAVASAAVLAGALDTVVPAWAAVLALAAALVALAPPVVNAAGSWAAGRQARLGLTWADTGAVVVLLAVTWTCYGLALRAVAPGGELDLVTAVASFTAAYAAGVLVVLAPAGLGAREAVLTLLLTPSLGVAGAAAAALLTRVVHTVADFSMAAGAWLLGRR